MLEECPECYGEGIDLGGYDEEVCTFCEGQGVLDQVSCDICQGKGCPRCDGQGSLYHVECPQCQSLGTVQIQRRCSVCHGFGNVIPRKYFEDHP